MSVTPKPPVLRTGVYDDEPATFGDITLIFRYMLQNHVRPSLSSPPIARDVDEFTLVFDKTLLRLYIKVDNTLRYVQFT